MPRRQLIVAFAVVLALLLPATALAQIGSSFGNLYSLSATLSGANEVPAADPDGFGYARITIFLDTSEVCFQLSVARIEPATAAHIHDGAAGVNGPVVVPLEAPVGGLSRGCAEADAALLTDILTEPWNYYVNVHTADYPGGAVRGQLEATGRQAPPPPPAEPEIEVVVDGLNNPRGADMAADGSVLVAEAGSGGDACFNAGTEEEPFELCIGLTGAVTMIADGVAEQVGDGLSSLSDPSGTFSGGPHDTATDADGNVYVVTGLGELASIRDAVAGDVPDAAGLGLLLMLADDGSWTEVADIAAYEETENPDGSEYADSNPYGVAVDGDTVLVADAGGNTLLTVAADGTISTFGIFPEQMVDAPPFLELPEGTQIPMQAVPTSVTVGPDGAYYVGTLTGFPFPVGGATVYRLEDLDGDGDALEEGEMTVYAEGLTAVIDVEFGADGTLYAVEFAMNGVLGAEDPEADETAVTGALVAIAEDGSQTEVVSAGLVLPGGVAVADDGSFYVTTHSVFPTEGEMTGQLVHVTMPE